MEERHLKEARKKVRKIKSFYSNLTSWAIFSIFFIGLNIFSYSGHFWAIYPILGWGIGVAFQGFDVFGMPGMSKDWEQREIQKELDRIQNQEAAQKWHNYNETRRISPPREAQDFEEYQDELELKEFREIRKDWKDSDFV